MKVLLLEHPRQITSERCNDIANTPLSSCLLSGYAAAMLKRDGHDVEIVEGYLDRLSYDEIGGKIESMKPDLVGVHMVYHWKQDHALFEFLERLKTGSAPYLTAFGFYPTVAYRDIMGRCQAIDSVIVGEPEAAFSCLAGSSLKRERVSRVPGLVVREDYGGFALTPPRPIEDLDSIPFPVRTTALLRLPEINILGSRGCYGKCTFCYVNVFSHGARPWRARGPENIIEEIDLLISTTGLRKFYFADPNFFGPGTSGQKRAIRIASLLKERDITFGIEGRVNDIHDRTIASLAEAGLRHILIGLESGSDDSLRRMKKMTTVAENERALGILRKHGIEPNVGFIMFEPNSNLEDIRTNFEFLKRNHLLENLSVTANVLYHHQIVLEGTEAYQMLKSEGRLETGEDAYEGTAYFRVPEVGMLSDLMRRITNTLFSLMDGIWSGQEILPVRAERKYEKANAVLVALFEDTLGSLEAGERFSQNDLMTLFSSAEKEVRRELQSLSI